MPIIRVLAVRVAALSVVLAGACSANPTPVHVVGPMSEVSRLAGTWVGEYSSLETGRSGSISFSLRAGTDSAFGDVVMVPRALAPTPTDPRIAHPVEPQVPQVLRIAFVRVATNVVSGTLDPYQSPDCGCILYTVFEGTLDRDRITGRFVTRHSDPLAPRQQGTWWVKREKAVAARK